METQVAEMKSTDQARLNEEYQRLVNGLAESVIPSRAGGGVGGGGGSGPGAGAGTATSAAADEIAANPTLPADILQEAVPGNIRRAEHFISFMRKVSFVQTVSMGGGVVSVSALARRNDIFCRYIYALFLSWFLCFCS